MEELDRIRKEAEADNHKLRQEILDSADEYARKVAAMERLHEDKIQNLVNDHDKQTKVHIVDLYVNWHMSGSVDTWGVSEKYKKQTNQILSKYL